MELAKLKKFLKEDTYVHCTICGNYRNSNSYAHRKSEAHKQKLKLKLQKISMHILQKKRKPFVVHDEQWEDKDSKRFCHFCTISYSEHYSDGEFIIESLGSLHHHADSHHFDAVNAFMDRNFCTESPHKFCILKEDLDKYLQKIPEAKNSYLKKMDIFDQAVKNQIKSADEERKKIVNDELQLIPSVNCELNKDFNKHGSEAIKCSSVLNKQKLGNAREIQVPPWLEDVPGNAGDSGSRPAVPVIGPTMDTLVKHVENQKRKGLPVKRVGADFKHHIRGSSRWLPSFQGVWNQGRRKQSKIQFNRRNQKF